MERPEILESNVRSYSRSFPAIFRGARGSIMITEDGRQVIDFFSGAGALNPRDRNGLSGTKRSHSDLMHPPGSK